MLEIFLPNAVESEICLYFYEISLFVFNSPVAEVKPRLGKFAEDRLRALFKINRGGRRRGSRDGVKALLIQRVRTNNNIFNNPSIVRLQMPAKSTSNTSYHRINKYNHFSEII